MKNKELTLKEFSAKGGRARAKKYPKKKLREWGLKGGRPKKTFDIKASDVL
jgi:hypothetical protein